jgi:hypothetical protein
MKRALVPVPALTVAAVARLLRLRAGGTDGVCADRLVRGYGLDGMGAERAIYLAETGR